MIPIVIPVNNHTTKSEAEIKQFVRCLSSIQKHTKDYMLIICLDGNVNEAMGTAAKNAKNRTTHISTLKAGDRATLNFGLGQARTLNTDYVAVVSPLAIVEKGWLEQMSSTIENDVVIGAVTSAPEGLPLGCTLFSSQALMEMSWTIKDEARLIARMEKLEWKIARIADLPVKILTSSEAKKKTGGKQ